MDVNGVTTYDAPAYTPPPPPAPAPAPAPVQESSAPEPQVSAVNSEREREPQTQVKSLEGLEKALDQINQSIASFHRHMQISVHQKTNRIMVKVMDTEKNEVIREIPPERALDAFAKALEMAGILIDHRR